MPDNIFLRRIEKEALKSSEVLIWVSVSFLVVVSIFDFLLLSQYYLELILFNTSSIIVILISHFLLSKVQKDPTLLLHIIQFVLSFLLLFSISITDSSSQIFYMVMLAVVFVTFNVIAVWKMYNGILQFVLLAILIYFFDYYDYLDIQNFFMLGGYTTFFICFASILFPPVKTSIIMNELKKGSVKEEEVQVLNDTVSQLKSEIKEMDAKFNFIDNKVKVFSHDLKKHLESIEEHTSIIDPNGELESEQGQEHHITILKHVLENATQISNQFFKDFQEDNFIDYKVLVSDKKSLNN